MKSSNIAILFAYFTSSVLTAPTTLNPLANHTRSDTIYRRVPPLVITPISNHKEAGNGNPDFTSSGHSKLHDHTHYQLDVKTPVAKREEIGSSLATSAYTGAGGQTINIDANSLCGLVNYSDNYAGGPGGNSGHNIRADGSGIGGLLDSGLLGGLSLDEIRCLLATNWGSFRGGEGDLANSV